jgi:hypothetical protein
LSTAFSHLLAKRRVPLEPVLDPAWKVTRLPEEVERWAAEKTTWTFYGLGRNSDMALEMERIAREWINDTFSDETRWPLGYAGGLQRRIHFVEPLGTE